jgi:porin
MNHASRTGTLAVLLAASAASALSQPAPSPGASPSAEPVQGPTEGNSPAAPSARSASPQGSTNAGETPFDTNLFGDAGGLRTKLGEHGVSLGLDESSEVLGNVTGGYRTGFDYEGVSELGLGIDTEKAFGLPGGTFNVTAFQYHGRGITNPNLGSTASSSGIEQTARGTKLFELWYEQVLFDEQLAIRAGQLSADTEFMLTEYGGLFINSGYGFPTLPADDLPSGGPAYPLATPAIRLKYVPSENWAVLVGVFNGDPAGPGTSDPQKRDGGGTAFRINDGTFLIGEVDYSVNPGDKAPGLAGTYKLGFWYNSLAFANQSFAGGAAPGTGTSSAAGPADRNDVSAYAVADQLLWKKPGTPDGGVAVFARAMGAPPDRNPIDVFVQGGVTYKAPFAGRDGDTVGVAVSWAHLSRRLARVDKAIAVSLNEPSYPIRSSETQLELTYQAQLIGSVQLQPDFQYIFNPGGGIPNPGRANRRVGDEAILGVRTTVTF